MAELFTLPKQVPIQSSGAPWAGAKAYFYRAGTTTDQSVYTDAACSVAHAQPVVADANGVFAPIYKNPAASYDYRLQLKQSDGTLIYDQDNIPRFTLTQGQVGQILWPRTAAEIAASVTPTNYYYEPGDVRRYGAVGDGVTNDSAAILVALNVAKADGGGKVMLMPGGTHYLGTYSADTSVFAVSELKNVVIDCAGAIITATVSGSYTVPIFDLTDPHNVVIDNLHFEGSGDDPTGDTAGFRVVRLLVSDASTDPVGMITLNNPYIKNVVSTVQVIPTAATMTRRFKGLRINGGRFHNCYYGPNFQQNGDDVFGDWSVFNIRRAYFPYGVRRHKVHITVQNDTAGYTADSCITIASQPKSDTTRAQYDTSDIQCDVAFIGPADYWGSLVTFYHVGATTPQVIRDIYVTLNLTETSDLTTTYPFRFKSHSSSGGAEETSTTQNIWKNIHLNLLGSEIINTARGAVQLSVSPNVPADIHLYTGMVLTFNALLDTTVSDYQVDNWLIYTSPRSFIKLKRGDLTSSAMVIDLSNIDTRRFSYRLKIWALNDRSVLSGQSVTYKEIIVTGYNAGGGSVAISQQDAIVSHSTGTASTITVAASGETLTISFTNYNSTGSRALVECENLWPFGNILG